MTRHRLTFLTALSTLSLAPGGVASAAPTQPLSLENDLAPVATCSCHSFDNSPDRRDEPSYAPGAWQGSLMANATRDPVFWAGVAIASQDDPEHTELCVRCHAPRATLEGRGEAIAPTELQPGDFNGVECDFCHRVVEDPMTPPGNAQYQLSDEAIDGFVPKRGPFEYPGVQPPHETVWDPYLGSGRFCGTCHDVTTDKERVDEQGVGMGMNFNEQRTYSEWVNSAYSQPGPNLQTCQDCHMPMVQDVAGCVDFDVAGELHPTGVRRHEFAGANRQMIEILKGVVGDAGTGEIRDSAFDFSLAATDRILAGAATVQISPPDQVDAGGEGLRDLTITVTNNAGHKLPSGYSEGRVMWLEVIASYGDQDVFKSGEYINGEGPTRDEQVRTYEAIAEDHSTGQQLHLLLNDRWIVDNRLPPQGLRPDIDTDPVGDRYELLPNGEWPHWDTATYDFDPVEIDDLTPDDETDDVLRVRVRLLYLINTQEYLDVLAEDNMTNAAGANVRAQFELVGGPTPLVLSDEEIEIPLVGLRRPGDTDTATGTAGTGTATAGTGTGTTGSGTTTGQDTTGSGLTTADPGTDTATDGDSDGDTDGGPDGSCECRSHKNGPGSLGIGLLGLAALSRRRRRP